MESTKGNHMVVGYHTMMEGAQGLPTILTVGHELRTVTDNYDWPCETREDAHCILQYTVSGMGEIEIEGVWHSVPAGRAFLIEVPGPFHYRLPANSDHWELRFVSLSRECLPWWSHIVTGLGRLVHFDANHPVVRKIEALCKQALTNNTSDAFHNSAKAYELLMELYRVLYELPGDEHLPYTVRRALQFIEQELSAPIGLPEIANTAGVSKFHIIRLFREHVGESPTQYLIKRRIRSAAKLLVETKLTIDEIARQTGFQNGNYFAKAFRKWVHASPSAFRRNAHRQGIEQIRIT
ncbi:AraC family transcriptional regulator [Alicyclobacillus fodiniaquatilis]|uniref:Helix-turn-helix domain-containing protein n=1 Tax=Alicyclobacillus fodiniaquatilis TaxID=1661150 RepID=A0ABW4JHJ8_9BACL